MHYYYDILVNLDEFFWEFYEWEKEDEIIPIKKIPFLKISNIDMKNLLSYDVVFDSDFVAKFASKTVTKSDTKKRNCLLLSDTQNTIFLEFDLEGHVISRSKLLIEDENNCNEIAHSLHKEEIVYKCLEKFEIRAEFRQEIQEKNFFQTELKTLKETNNWQKCSYLYYEWFGKNETDMEKMLKDLEEILKGDYQMKLHEMVHLIKMSYKGNL